MAIHNPQRLVESLCSLPRETEWLEFKLSTFEADTIGRYMSSLANSAIFCNVDKGYLVFGVADDTHEILGTALKIDAKKVGNDSFLYWLNKMIEPRVNIEYCRFTINDKPVEMLVIEPGYQQPIKFKKIPYIRIDTSLHPLSSHPERERAIWQATSRFSFEQTIARAHVKPVDLESLFYVQSLVNELKASEPSQAGLLEYLAMEDLVRDNGQGGVDVTNRLVLASARNFKEWPGLERKGVRVIQYTGKSKLEAKTDTPGTKGYSVTFNGLLNYVMERIPHREEMQHGKRVTLYDIPRIAIRELLANAIIHQDLTATGDGPLVEIFTDRLKITNPGRPLISTDRFIDSPSRSRNAKFGALMRRLGLCEERGSGVDRAVSAIERAILPPPLFQQVEDTTVATLYGPRPFADMTKDERVRACYQHACLAFESGENMSNSTLRHRLGLSDKQASLVSIVISDAKEANYIKPVGEDQANRNARYLPIWA